MQLTMNLPVNVPDTVYEYGARASGETHGVVLTKPHVVDLILDLAGYSVDRDLGSLAFLEPACGAGAFLVPAVKRLLESARRERRDLATLSHAIAAYDIDETHVARSRQAVGEALFAGGVPAAMAKELAETWVVRADFLLSTQARLFDVVVGNPPYIRIEQIAALLQAEYRARYASLYDRADLYVAFIERALDLLSEDGVLSFVCANRWTLNKYGGPLRRLVTERFGVRCYIDMGQASPFESDVIAYPAIFAIGRRKNTRVHVASLANGSPDECRRVLPAMESAAESAPGVRVSVYRSWFKGDEPWVLVSPEHLDALRALESRFPPIEADGRTRVGIGVATGNDDVFIVGDDVDIEPDRLVPLVMRDDIESGRIRNARRFVINTFAEDGAVVDLRIYPRLAKYLGDRGAGIRKRYVSQKNPASWFRTIDRVYPDLVSKPKLLIPDISGANEVVFDEGHFHPHHNLYFVTSDAWDMEVLGGLLISKVALFFVWSYAVKMRGDYLRFQAQYLRRIRLPAPDSIPAKLAGELKDAFRRRDVERLDQLAFRAFGLDDIPAFDFVDTRKGLSSE